MRFVIEIPDELFRPQGSPAAPAVSPGPTSPAPHAVSEALSGGAAPPPLGGVAVAPAADEAISAGPAEQPAGPAVPPAGDVPQDGGAAPR
jgi:hypothetical protein